MHKFKMTHLVALSALSISIAACSVFQGSETSGQYVDDATITSRVKTRIAEQPGVRSDFSQIHVETMRGVVQLSGFVNNQGAKDAAENIAAHVPGVRAVKDDIVVRPQGTY